MYVSHVAIATNLVSLLQMRLIRSSRKGISILKNNLGLGRLNLEIKIKFENKIELNRLDLDQTSNDELYT